GGRPAERVDCYLDFFRRRGIAPGPRGDHLQSLVLFATRAVLERVGGFPECTGYGEAIAAEIGVCKRVQAAGLAVAEVGPEPFFSAQPPRGPPGRGGAGGRRPCRAPGWDVSPPLCRGGGCAPHRGGRGGGRAAWRGTGLGPARRPAPPGRRSAPG